LLDDDSKAAGVSVSVVIASTDAGLL
jgi:hypothetical protein